MVESSKISIHEKLLQLDIIDWYQKDGTVFYSIKICKKYEPKDF